MTCQPNLCACMGPMYNEPYCPCAMRERGLPPSPEHEAAMQKAEEDLDRLFGPGGAFHCSESEE